MTKYVDEGGVENIACALIEQAKKDFIKGGRVLYAKIRSIPSYSDLITDQKHISLSNSADVRWMYDAWRFVRDDPYQFFGDVGEEPIIQAWKEEAIKEYYKMAYLKGGTLLYINRAKKKIHELSDDEVISIMDDNKISENFIEARNYVNSLENGDKIFHEWNVMALSRSRKRYYKDLIKNGYKPTNSYHQKLKENKEKNRKMAIELFESGMSEQAIARYLGVQKDTVQRYLKS